jgi:hypothetical protein
MMRAYRALLHLYPASFRAEYGEEMRAIFARHKGDAAGAAAVAALWVATFFEVLLNAAALHGDILRQDLRYTVRSLGRCPGFALTAILVTALGVGANTAAFSVTDFVLIRPLPFAQPDTLVKLWERLPGYSRMELSPANYVDWQRMGTAFEAMGAFYDRSVNLVGQGNPERLERTAVTASLFPMLGVHPLMGRLFGPADDRAGAAGTLLLSHGLWKALFGGDASVIGRRVTLDNEPSWSSESCRRISIFRAAKPRFGRPCVGRNRILRNAITITWKWWRGFGTVFRSTAHERRLASWRRNWNANIRKRTRAPQPTSFLCARKYQNSRACC